MTFTIIWRIEDGGDFFEQAYPNSKSASLAINQWRRLWGLHEADCFLFEVKKGETK